MNGYIQEKLALLPDEPGVYLMKNKADQIIYVGKAKNLKKRVRQYFGSYGKSAAKVRAMVGHIADFEYIIVHNELESLILESNLIKEYYPKYNILLRDDKQYPYIKVTNERFPRVMKTRRILKDGAKYYGPYPNALAVNEAIEVFHEVYPIRNCKLNFNKNFTPIRPCLNYFINRCIGPCTGEVSDEEYQVFIDEIVEFLEGKEESLLKKLEGEMRAYSSGLNFEGAARRRDQLEALRILSEKQMITDAGSLEEYDMIHLAKDEGHAVIQIFFFRQGKNMGREHFLLDNPYGEDSGALLTAFITQFYHGTAYIPAKIYIPVELEQQELIEEMLRKKREGRVQILVPKIGEKRATLRMVQQNALDMLTKYGESYKNKNRKRMEALEELQKITGLSEPIVRIEAYDISNISGVESVGSMVVFENGRGKKTDYRRFRIKSIRGADDYGSLREVLTRRFVRGEGERSSGEKATSFSYYPDLILMDGGKGQVGVAQEVLRELGIPMAVAGLVKDQHHTTRGIIFEGREYNMKKTSPLYRLIYEIQEEAHRFAINYHRSLRNKATFRSELDDIAGIGPKRKKALMAHFKTISKIKAAEVEELLEVPAMNRRAAESLYEHFRGTEEQGPKKEGKNEQ
ncbi:MAG: excinuclease ABC subunit UvrC [Tissierellia bacterium]|nr:excinuclease ABC subunit UvrC [Tissierellia bacterium]